MKSHRRNRGHFWATLHSSTSGQDSQVSKLRTPPVFRHLFNVKESLTVHRLHWPRFWEAELFLQQVARWTFAGGSTPTLTGSPFPFSRATSNLFWSWSHRASWAAIYTQAQVVLVLRRWTGANNRVTGRGAAPLTAAALLQQKRFARGVPRPHSHPALGKTVTGLYQDTSQQGRRVWAHSLLQCRWEANAPSCRGYQWRKLLSTRLLLPLFCGKITATQNPCVLPP